MERGADEATLKLPLTRFLGGLRELPDPPPLPEATWYEAEEVGDGLEFTFPPGTLAGKRYLTADLLLDGNQLAVFVLELQEGEDGPTFRLHHGLLNQCQARIRLPLSATDQNRWLLPREGAWLKPICSGDRVDVARVDRIRYKLLRKGTGNVRWAMTLLVALEHQPLAIGEPLLPKGPLLDELGQSTLHDWPQKTRSVEVMVSRLRAQLDAGPRHRWPHTFSRWGGWRQRESPPSDFFRVHHDGSRWWLVAPDGRPFWSAGLDCVRSNIQTYYEGLESALAWLPPRDGEFADAHAEGSFNHLAANFIRAFGPQDWHKRWATIALGELRRIGFNTMGNWSEWEVASRARFPYVRPMSFRPSRVKTVFRDFPDVFDRAFARDAAAYARQLAPTVEDPALVGYFLMNEPNWGFASLTPAEGMLLNTPECATREALARFLRERYPDDQALCRAWGVETTIEEVARGPWRHPLNAQAKSDLEAFSAVMVERFFKTLSEACRAVDPNHLNLGARYHTVPPPWALAGMRCFDVFSINCYRERVPDEFGEKIVPVVGRPVLIGEWHFGALDVGLPASGIGHVPSQADRGKAYRVYLEDAAAKPWCVGVHYFTMYDQSALGRGDGENYNIGFFDVCHRPYEQLAHAARESHERLYQVAAWLEEPFDDEPPYLPKLFN